MVVAAPFLNEEVLAVKLYLLLCAAVAVGKPGTRLANTVAGIHLTIGIFIITFIFVVYVHQPYGSVATLSIDTTLLGIGITSVQVAEERFERHMVRRGTHGELTGVVHPVTGLCQLRQQRHEAQQHEMSDDSEFHNRLHLVYLHSSNRYFLNLIVTVLPLWM